MTPRRALATSTDAASRRASLDGELLRLTAERTLSAPTLYDDVVDAAARLNKAGYPGWDATAARWMTFAGTYLASGTWIYFLVADTFAATRAVLLGLSVVAALALVGCGRVGSPLLRADTTSGQRWAGRRCPIVAAIAWAALAGLGGYEVGRRLRGHGDRCRGRCIASSAPDTGAISPQERCSF